MLGALVVRLELNLKICFVRGCSTVSTIHQDVHGNTDFFTTSGLFFHPTLQTKLGPTMLKNDMCQRRNSSRRFAKGILIILRSARSSLFYSSAMHFLGFLVRNNMLGLYKIGGPFLSFFRRVWSRALRGITLKKRGRKQDRQSSCSISRVF